MIEVVCAVVARGGRVLVCRRPAGAHLAGHWEFPGGKVEDGEDPDQALVREIREELACTVVVGQALGAVEHSYPDLKIRLQPFRCTILRGEPRALEHEELGWFAPEEMNELELAGADRAVWESFRAEV